MKRLANIYIILFLVDGIVSLADVMTDRCLGIRPFRIIRGIDALDGTPLLDIKPYIPRFDYHRNAGSGWVARVKNRRKPKGRE